MFDVAFSEILVIAVVALIVIGPEKLPKVARTLGLLTGRLQRYVSTVKADIERELRMEDLRKMEEDARRSILDTGSEISAQAHKTEDEIKSAVEATSNEPASPPASPDKLEKPHE